MFSRKEQLLLKTGPDGVGRYSFLKQLAEEFEKTKSLDCKLQVLANLANFSYDPINYEHIRNLKILDIFLDQLSVEQEELLHFGLAAICNLSSDPVNREYILRNNGIFLVSEQLSHKNEEITLNALTSLIFLITPNSHATITSPNIISKVALYKNHPNVRFRNLAAIFLDDYCTKKQIECAENF